MTSKIAGRTNTLGDGRSVATALTVATSAGSLGTVMMRTVAPGG